MWWWSVFEGFLGEKFGESKDWVGGKLKGKFEDETCERRERAKCVSIGTGWCEDSRISIWKFIKVIVF